MPELPEVENIVRGLRKMLIGQQIGGIELLETRIIKSSLSDFKEQLPGSVFRDIQRIGKIIVISFSHGLKMIIHLKMTGQLLVHLQPRPILSHTHLIIELVPRGDYLIYRDIRRFGFIYLASCEDIYSLPPLRNIGPDALAVQWADFRQILSKSKGNTKSRLLDQSLLAGIGNIYADEILFRAKIHPEQRIERLSLNEQKRLYDSMQFILKKAAKNGGSSIRNYLNSEGQPGQFQRFHNVYGRKGQPCNRCAKPIQRIRLASRSSHFCPNCQKICQ